MAVEIKPDAEVQLEDGALDQVNSVEEIKSLLHAKAAEQGIKPEGKAAPEVKGEEKEDLYHDSFVIGGKEYTFYSETPAGINQQVKAAMAAHDNATKPVVQVDDAAATKKAQDELAAIKVRMLSGDPKAFDEYIEKSGAIDKYLAKQGIPASELKEVVEERKSDKVTQSWEAATAAFLKDSDWPGGDQNLKLMGLKLAELGLGDKPPVESLKAGYESMKSEGLLFPVEPVEAPKAQKKAAASSSVFNTGGGAGRDRATTKKEEAPKITENMSPWEILEAWKTGVQAEGRHPDEAIREAFAPKR